MQKEYILQGLDCANCAGKIEKAVSMLEHVASAAVNFMALTLRVEASDEYSGNITEDIEEIVHRYEPDVRVIDKSPAAPATPGGTHTHEHDHGHDHAHGGAESLLSQLLPLIIGAALFAAGVLIGRFANVSEYVPLAVFVAGYLALGGKVVLQALRNIVRGQIFDENLLMSVATIGAFAIGDYAEAVAVMLFYQIGELFSDLAVRRTRRSISDLMDIRPDYANLQKGGEIEKVAPELVNIGDIIIVRPGEKIPLDGVVRSGESMLDTRALTGESVPRRAAVGDTVLAGCVNQNGVLTVVVAKTFGESTVAKIIDLVENAGSKKAPTESFITKFSRYYTPVVVILAALLAVIPPLFVGGWADWVNRGLIFLVISCPCALVISIPLGFFGGIGGASKRGILIKGGNYLEALNNVDIAVFDKTGTLTKGVFEVTAIHPADGITPDELLRLAANAEAFSNHPIALSILRAYTGEIDKTLLTDYRELPGLGISASLGGVRILSGNAALMDAEGLA